MGVEGINSGYSEFVNLYGPEAADRAKELGFFDDLQSGNKTWLDLVKWAKNEGYDFTPQLQAPSDYDITGATDAINQFYEMGLLFHQLTRQMRRAQREDTFILEHKIVQTLKEAAQKKIDAAHKLESAAVVGLVLTCACAALSVASAAMSFVSAIKAVTNAATKAAESAVKEAVKELVNVAKKAAQKAVQNLIKAGEKVTEKAIKKAVKEAVENVTKEIVENVTKKAVDQAMKQLGKLASKSVRETLEKTIKETVKNTVEKLSKKMVNRVAKEVTKEVEEIGTKAAKMVPDKIEEVAEKAAKEAGDEVSESITKSIEKSIAKLGKQLASSTSKKYAAVAAGLQGLGQGLEGGSRFVTTKGQADSQTEQAKGDKINAEAEGMKGLKQRDDDYLNEINATLRAIQEKLAEFVATRAKQMEAAARC